MKTVMVTGGAGYVGAHVCCALSQAGYRVVAYDNLCNGHAAFARWGPLEIGDIRDKARLRAAFAAHKPDAVVHCAALIDVGASVGNPRAFYDVNVIGTLNLLDAIGEAGGEGGGAPIVFSSSCATYGAPQTLPMPEDHAQAPINPYGWSKLVGEQVIRDYGAAFGVPFALLRYFNAAGAAPAERIGERHTPETHAIPLALFTLLGRSAVFKIYGVDYDTSDGSCVRDYVHVLDLAAAHVRAVDRLTSGGASLAANLGAGAGVSVLELIRAIEAETGRKIPVEAAPRRAGDAPALIACGVAARRDLGWTPEHDIRSIVRSAWEWHASVEAEVFRADRQGA